MQLLHAAGDSSSRTTSTFRTTATACALLVLGTGTGACRDVSARDRITSTLVVGVIAPADGTGESAARGARLGAEEAERTGALLGHAMTVYHERADGVVHTVALANRLLGQGAQAIVGGFDQDSCAALDSLASARGVVFVNVGCRADALRSGTSSATFHVEASDSMYLAAIALTRTTGGGAPVLWDPTLVRYGAAQLNQRFVRRFGEPADAAAWASWMALKLLFESAHARDVPRRATLAARLRHGDAEFDGHKGEALRFVPGTQQLRQPLFAPATGYTAVARPDHALETVTAPEQAALRRAFSDSASLLVVTNEGSADVSIVHAERGEMLATLRFAARPRGVQASADGRTVWVALSDEAPTQAGDGDAIVEIDLLDGSIRRRYQAGSDPEQFAVTRDGRLLVAANEDAGTATIITLDAGTSTRESVPSTLLVGIEPEGVAVSADGRWAYVTAETSNTVTVIDLRRAVVVASFLVDERPRAVAFAPDGRRAYVSNEISGTMTVIDVTRHEPVHTVLLASGRARPVGLLVSPDGGHVYVANGHANSVSVIDTRTLREIAVIEVGRRPWGLALSRDGRHLYAANGGSGTVSVIDVGARAVSAVIAVGDRPWGVAVTR